MRVIADADQIDIALAVDLAAGQKEHIDPALPGAVEQFASAVGEEGVLPAAEERDVRPAVAFLASDGAGFVTGQKISVNGSNTLE